MRKTLSITTAFILLTLILTQWAQGFEVRLKWKENTVTNALPVTIYVTFATWQPADDDDGLPNDFAVREEGDRTVGYYRILPGDSRTFHAAGNESIFFRFQRFDGFAYAPVMYLSPAADTPTVSSWVPVEFEDIPLLEGVGDDLKAFHFPVSDYESLTYKSFNIVTPTDVAFGAATLGQIKFTDVPERLLEIEDGFIKYQNGSDVTVTGEWWIRWGAVAQTTPAVFNEDFGVFSPGDVVSILGDPVRADNNNFGHGTTPPPDDGEETIVDDPLSSYIRSVAFSPDGQTLASGSEDETIRLWDVATRQTQKTLEGHASSVDSVAFSPDGQTLASGSWDQTIRLWNVDTGDTLKILQRHTAFINSVVFSPDGRTLASGNEDQTIRLWNVDTGDTLKTLQGHTDSVSSVAFSPDGQTLASGSADTTIRLWNVATGDTLKTLQGHTNYISSVAFSPDGQTLASGSADDTIRLWNVATGDTLKTLQGHTNSVSSVSFSPDGQTLASGSADTTIRLWDVATGDTLKTLQGHTDFVSSVAFSPDGQTLASGSLDQTVRFWDITPTAPPPIEFQPWDVNADGQTTIVDLILVITNHNRTPLLNPRADVNADGTVDKQDIVIVAEHLGDSTAATAPTNWTMPDGLTPTTLQEALNILQAHDDGSFAYQRSITYLERLLAAVIPEKTLLLPNYPNPFNPETWIPYYLSEPADVAVTIYAIDGTLVRTLSLGQQPAGGYQRRSRAAYWDGKNAAGEPVASGLYFYTLKAGDFAATRKMLIRK